RQARRTDPPDAVGRLADSGRRARHGRSATAEWFRVRVAVTAGISVRLPGAEVVHQHAAAAGHGPRCAGSGPFRLPDGEVLWRHIPWAAARAWAGRRAGRRHTRADRSRLAGAGMLPPRPSAGPGDSCPSRCRGAAERREAPAATGSMVAPGTLVWAP